ncbi:MAG TPA: ATP-binding protein [Mycobacteriales bacterium]|nr:ATP-binding protein [Mycobacteriales bacterium]
MLAAWTASPARFREDANAEQDLTHGAYRDRLLVELAQNAADAAARAGITGALRLSVVDGELRAANTGAPLDAAGAEALATLRASAKRDGDSVGRFGVGFAAVLTVTDAPVVASTTGGLRFSAADTRAAVAAVPALAAELDRRSGQVPVLRLPWAADPLPPGEWDTEVRLPLRPEAAEPVRAALSTVDPVLLLALPALGSIDADGRLLSRADGPDGTVVLRDGPVESRWVVRSARGLLPDDLLAARPAEERDRPEWTVSWAVPVSAAGRPVPPATRPVVHAPTPTDEPLSLPAVLLGTFPLGSDRRHVVPGPVTDLLVTAAAALYAELIAALPPDPALLDLVPRPRLAAAELDAALAHAILAGLRTTPWLPVAGDDERVRPVDAVVVDAAGPELVDALADLVPGLLGAQWSGRGRAAALTALGVRRLGTADVVELVAGVQRPPAWWRALYAALADRPEREALAGLAVPLADGRTVTGARGVLLPDAGLPAAAASALGLRIVHPDAAHPLLERLGATPATARGVLADERVLAAVAESYEEEDPEPVAESVLALVGSAELRPGEIPELAELALRADDGDWYPAGELLLPGSPLAAVVAADAPFETVAGDLVDRYGPDALAAVGVLRTFAVLRTGELDLDPDAADHDLDGEADWMEAVLDRLPPQPVPPRIAALVAVRDLDLVADWDRAIPLLSGTSPTVEVQLADGTHRHAPSYTTWWLSTHRTLAGRRPDRLRTPAALDLAGLYDEAAGDPETLALVGVAAGLEDVLADPDRALDLLDRLGDPARTAPAAILPTVYARLALVLEDAAEPPERVRTTPDSTVPRAAAVVLDRPYLLPLLDRTPVPAGTAPGPVADLLDLPTASELLGAPTPDGQPRSRRRWADVPGAALAAARCAGAVPDAAVAVHDELTVGGTAVGWWPDGETDHTDGSPDALGRALAWRLGAWPARAAAAEALARPDDARLTAEDALS